MANILEQIAEATRERVAREKKRNSLETYKRLVERDTAAGVAESAAADASFDKDGLHRFTAALSTPGMSFICEVKKASPSKGIIAEKFPYVSIARAYEAAGAAAISCLTEPTWFKGNDIIFSDIRMTVPTPMLRKDFVVDDYQLYQAKAIGADAVLLICALHDAKTLARRLEITRALGMAALVEAHDEAEVKMAVDAGAAIIGVNNRNLKDFSVDFGNAARLRDLIPPECLYVAESGVKSADDVAALAKLGADAVLMGEVLMRADDTAALLASMREASRR